MSSTHSYYSVEFYSLQSYCYLISCILIIWDFLSTHLIPGKGSILLFCTCSDTSHFHLVLFTTFLYDVLKSPSFSDTRFYYSSYKSFGPRIPRRPKTVYLSSSTFLPLFCVYSYEYRSSFPTFSLSVSVSYSPDPSI